MTVGAPGGPANSRMNVVPRPGSSMRRPCGTSAGARTVSAAESTALDLQRPRGSLEVDDVADTMAEQRLAERRPGGDDLEVIVAFFDRADQVALCLVVTLVADLDDRARLDDFGAA